MDRSAFHGAGLAADVGLLAGDRTKRNNTLVDIWSWGHVVLGAAMAWVMPAFWALLILVLWEPLEILVLSPLIWRFWHVEFGYETLRNSTMDIVFDAVGVALGRYVLRPLVDPPFFLGAA